MSDTQAEKLTLLQAATVPLKSPVPAHFLHQNHSWFW